MQPSTAAGKPAHVALLSGIGHAALTLEPVATAAAWPKPSA